MFQNLYEIRYPEGDCLEIEHSLSFNQLVDLNGRPLRLPLPDPRIVAYRVYRINTETSLGVEKKIYHLERMTLHELVACSI